MEVDILASTLCVFLLFLGTQSAGLEEYCQWETFNATCNDNQVVMMETARYGRMDIGRCVAKNYGSLGCSQDVLGHMDRVCSGRRHCSISIPDDHLRSLKPCPKDFANYLHTSYSCVHVEGGYKEPCYSSGPVHLHRPLGYISSVLTEETGLGVNDCPWMIKAHPGQRINITLLDFDVRQPGGGHKLGGSGLNEVLVDRARHKTFCHKYATIRERQAPRETVVCGGDLRERIVYISATNEVEIQIAKYQSPKHNAHFLLRYEAIGCPSLEKPQLGWMERGGEKVMFGCNHTQERWYMKCDGSRWIGEMRNCTDNPEAQQTFWHVLSGDDWASPFGKRILIVSALGVALGLVIGVTLLSIVLFFVKRHKSTCWLGDAPYVDSAQDGDLDLATAGYVLHNKRSSAGGLVDQMELLNMTAADGTTYGSVWSGRTPPPGYTSELGSGDGGGGGGGGRGGGGGGCQLNSHNMNSQQLNMLETSSLNHPPSSPLPLGATTTFTYTSTPSVTTCTPTSIHYSQQTSMISSNNSVVTSCRYPSVDSAPTPHQTPTQTQLLPCRACIVRGDPNMYESPRVLELDGGGPNS